MLMARQLTAILHILLERNLNICYPKKLLFFQNLAQKTYRMHSPSRFSTMSRRLSIYVISVIVFTCICPSDQLKIQPSSMSRRSFVVGVGMAFAGGSSANAVLVNPYPQELFRIFQQNSADVIRYKGELVDPLSPNSKPGSETARGNLVALLNNLASITTISDPQELSKVIMDLPIKVDEVPKLKKVFNAYADNIFFTPESQRGNKYLSGGAEPTSEQSVLYLLRNNIIDGLLALEAECRYVLTTQGNDNDNDNGDLEGARKELRDAVNLYLMKIEV